MTVEYMVENFTDPLIGVGMITYHWGQGGHGLPGDRLGVTASEYQRNQGVITPWQYYRRGRIRAGGIKGEGGGI